MKTYLLPIFALLIVGCGNRQTKKTVSQSTYIDTVKVIADTNTPQDYALIFRQISALQTKGEFIDREYIRFVWSPVLGDPSPNEIPYEYVRAFIDIDIYHRMFMNSWLYRNKIGECRAEGIFWRLNQCGNLQSLYETSEKEWYNTICDLIDTTIWGSIFQDFGTSVKKYRASFSLMIYYQLIQYYQDKILEMETDRQIREALNAEFKAEDEFVEQLYDCYDTVYAYGQWYSHLHLERCYYIGTFAKAYANSLFQLYSSYRGNQHTRRPSDNRNLANDISLAYRNFYHSHPHPCDTEVKISLADSQRCLNENQQCWDDFMTKRHNIAALLPENVKATYEYETKKLEINQLNRLSLKREHMPAFY